MLINMIDRPSDTKFDDLDASHKCCLLRIQYLVIISYCGTGFHSIPRIHWSPVENITYKLSKDRYKYDGNNK